MRCVYINLDRSLARREFLEANFIKFAQDNCQINRFAAIDGENLAVNSEITISSSEYACMLSHYQVIKSLENSNEAVLIAEDDILFGRSSFHLISSLVKQTKNIDWDIIFTDLTITNFTLMMEIIKIRQQVLQNKTNIIFSNAKFFANFAGSTAYLISPRGVAKLSKLLENIQAINVPYDIYLRQLIYENKINALVVVPFITSVSPFSMLSNIQVEENIVTRDKLLWLLFRRFIFVDANQSECQDELSNFKQLYANDLSDKLAVVLANSFAAALD